MSFWSRNKKKDNAPTQTQPAITTLSSTPAGASTHQPPASYQRANGIPTPSSKGISSQSPPDSPSAVAGPKLIPGLAPAGAGSGSPWSMRKFRTVNPFPRYGHASNVTAGKEGEIYVFGGLVKDKRKNDLFVIDSGMVYWTIRR